MPESRRQSITPTISTYHLYNRTGSSCARRVRIALSLKKVPNLLYHDVEKYTRTSIGTKQYLAINPSGAVPTLIHEITTPGHSTKQRFVLTQSTAILEYLDEMFPGLCPLMPLVGNREERARMRELVAVVTQDMFPFANRGNGVKLCEVAKATEEGRLEFIRVKLNEGFDAYEAMLVKCGGRYSVGDELSMADVCLVPQVLQAQLWGVFVLGCDRWPLIKAVVGRLARVQAFAKEMGDIAVDEETVVKPLP
ncbi:maleylacetoacetate isomerase maia [Alternaria rosae]|uniref:maleylacetoacetate isomerase maia n=1 Tax=Alternaria rosae TaxID=1187941 RepID=UPI001E8DA0D4|nr:maleylacetoacetate isomerase maia [Alternaria rosae]KAH6870074.1 maleylacetoacetate isomerase maia [Alternaria rosae]